MQQNSYSIHGTGNGQILAYHHGPDIIQLFGPPYSSPSLCNVTVTGDPAVEDFVLCKKPVFVREIKGKSEHVFHFPDYVTLKDISFRYSDATVYQAVIRSGAYVFFYYPLNRVIYYNILFKGGNVEAQENRLIFRGEGSFAVIGGENYPDTVINTKEYLKCDIELEKKKFFLERDEYIRSLIKYDIPEDIPERDGLLKAIYGTINSLIAQQDDDGGVIAGYPYHLGYVRDQFGVVKGMIKLGMKAEAFKILYFFLDVFKREGRINNAAGLGIPGILHVHENDDVEITGYIVLMFFDLYSLLENKEEKQELFDEFFPMLKWAVEAQAKQVIHGMVPFNGDETYIAGGILPRNAIFDGSSEATVLFIDSAKRFLEEIKALCYEYDAGFVQEKLNECAELFKENFIREGKLITNNPVRTELGEIPGFRHGVCEGYCGFFGWLEKSCTGLYLCTDCLKREKDFTNNRRVHALKSVLLLPMFIESSFIRSEDIYDEIYEISAEYLKTGLLPSVQGGNRNLGYDFGFLLNALNQILKVTDKNDERFSLFAETAKTLYRDTLNLVDETYTWCEYYNDKKCSGTQYRPWESAINIKALIEFAEIWGTVL